MKTKPIKEYRITDGYGNDKAFIKAKSLTEAKRILFKEIYFIKEVKK